MLRIKTKLGPSGIEGIGLFADEFVPSGTVTWRYDSQIDPSFTEEELEALPELNKEFMYRFCYFDKQIGKFILCIDNQRHINHSENPEKVNIQSSPTQDIAIKDIQIGEELLCDYFLFDSDYFDRMGVDRLDLR